MDEAFDMWMKEKTKYDYHLDFAEWHKRDLEDMVLRDRNHPSVFMWSIGNEINEQWDHKDSSGSVIAKELAGIIKNLDTTRPVVSNCNDDKPGNPLIESGALDIIGYSYGHNDYALFPKTSPGKSWWAPKRRRPLKRADITICLPTVFADGPCDGTFHSPPATRTTRSPHTTM